MMSKNLKRTKDAATYQPLSVGTASSGIHIPIISSMTTRLGSSPQNGSNWLAAQVPTAVNKTMRVNVVKNKVVGLNVTAIASHRIVARKAPAVPGPHGQNPLPKPVPIITANSGGRSISRCKINRKNINIQRVFFKILRLCISLHDREKSPLFVCGDRQTLGIK